jgi:hypothetical protein
MTHSDILIKAYPLCNEYYELEWMENLPGFIKEEQEEYFDFFQTMVEVVEANFKKELDKMKPFLVESNIRQIGIAIDWCGIFSNKYSLASYFPENSNPEKGNYTFVVNRTLLAEFLGNRFDAKPFDSHITTTWQHEIMNALKPR